MVTEISVIRGGKGVPEESALRACEIGLDAICQQIHERSGWTVMSGPTTLSGSLHVRSSVWLEGAILATRQITLIDPDEPLDSGA